MPNRVHLLHFLLVEDDEDHAHIVQRSLKRSRVANTLDHVDDGAKAVDYLKQRPPYTDVPRPDVVLLDLKLPKLDGHEVLSAIKNDPALCSLPVVVLTTSDSETDRTRAYHHHVNSYVVKPLNAEGFRKLVEDLNVYWGLVNLGPPPNAVETD